MAHARVIADVQTRTGKPARQIAEIVEANSPVEGFLRAGGELDWHRQDARQFAKLLQRPVLGPAAGKRMYRDEIPPGD
jgi:hypothetical protein